MVEVRLVVGSGTNSVGVLGADESSQVASRRALGARERNERGTTFRVVVARSSAAGSGLSWKWVVVGTCRVDREWRV